MILWFSVRPHVNCTVCHPPTLHSAAFFPTLAPVIKRSRTSPKPQSVVRLTFFIYIYLHLFLPSALHHVCPNLSQTAPSAFEPRSHRFTRTPKIKQWINKHPPPLNPTKAYCSQFYCATSIRPFAPPMFVILQSTSPNKQQFPAAPNSSTTSLFIPSSPLFVSCFQTFIPTIILLLIPKTRGDINFSQFFLLYNSHKIISLVRSYSPRLFFHTYTDHIPGILPINTLSFPSLFKLPHHIIPGSIF